MHTVLPRQISAETTNYGRNVSVGKQDQSTPRLFLCTKAVFQINPVVSKHFGISDIRNSAPFHQSRHFNCIKFIFHLHSVLSCYWSVSGESSYGKKQKFIKSLPLAHIRENQAFSGKRIFPREMKYKILFQNVYTLHTYTHTYEEERGRGNINQKILIADNVATITWRLLS